MKNTNINNSTRVDVRPMSLLHRKDVTRSVGCEVFGLMVKNKPYR